jgi:hypothetical protein
VRISTVNVADVQNALGALLLGDAQLIDMTELTIEHGEIINKSEDRCPWIGVYCIGVNYELRTIGLTAGMRYQKMSFWLVCTEQSPNSGNECTKNLEHLVQLVNSAVLSDTSLGGTVDTIEDFRTDYPQWGKTTGGVYLQTAVTQFTAVTLVRAGG